MKRFAKENNKQVNYLIELGFRKLLSNNEINLSEDRVQYKSTYDKQLLNDIRVLARREKVFINDLIEYARQKSL